jgi:hypothetical protein
MATEIGRWRATQIFLRRKDAILDAIQTIRAFTENRGLQRDAGRIADEVISHLTALVGSEVKVTLEIGAQVPNGVPENTVRTVTENSRTLKFDTQGFEKDQDCDLTTLPAADHF